MDYMISAIVKDEPIRLFAIDSTNMVSEAQKVHNTLPTASAALGRTITCVAMMGMMLKNESDKITVQIKCDGPIKGIIAVGNSKGQIKADIYNPKVHLPLNKVGKLDVSTAVGKGSITVIRDLGLKKPYIGTTEIISGEIAEDFSYYFGVSEQVPTVVALGVLVNPDGSIKKAGGYLIQLLPGHTDELIDYVENRIREVPSVSNMLDEGLTPENILEKIFEDYEIKFTAEKSVEYHCDCNRDRFERGLISLGREELEKIIVEDGQAEVLCHFCYKTYNFTKEELIELKNQSK